MKMRTWKRFVGAALTMAMAAGSLVMSSGALAATRRRDDDGFLSSYPVGGYGNYYYGSPYYGSSYTYGNRYYPGYWGGYNDNREYLGGVSSPRGLRRSVTVNDKSMDWTVLGRSVESEGQSGIITPSAANNLDFGQSLGRAADGSLCLIINVVGTGVSADAQRVLGLYGRIEGLEKLKAEGVESLAIVNLDGSLRITYDITKLIVDAKDAFEEKGTSIKKDMLLLSTVPGGNATDDAATLTSARYSNKIYTVSGSTATEISSLMSGSKMHIMLYTDTSKSKLVGTSEDASHAASDASMILRGNAYFATGYLPVGCDFAAIAK